MSRIGVSDVGIGVQLTFKLQIFTQGAVHSFLSIFFNPIRPCQRLTCPKDPALLVWTTLHPTKPVALRGVSCLRSHVQKFSGMGSALRNVAELKMSHLFEYSESKHAYFHSWLSQSFVQRCWCTTIPCI
ncbi:Uncharacterized protein HZ326_23112 [Fusarium oxysporum f. sp. albedinis]|nr:Uncharacterized protein HZ326_23112 [Fusarium oxysporum f. sp. albedinis]